MLSDPKFALNFGLFFILQHILKSKSHASTSLQIKFKPDLDSNIVVISFIFTHETYIQKQLSY